MKTTLKTLICVALCCAAAAGTTYSQVGLVISSATTLVDFEFPAGTPVTSVGLGAGTDVFVKINVTNNLGDPYEAFVALGDLQLQIAVDTTTGNPTTVAGASAPGGDWVRIALANPDATTGDHTFPVNLDGLAALNIQVGVDAEDNPIYLQNVTCDNTTVGFRGNYLGVPGVVLPSHSVGSPLTIECDECGASTDLTLSLGDITGPGSPSAPGSYNWCYTFTVQNCTDSNLTGIKVQGGTSGWTTLARLGAITVSTGNYTTVTKNKTSIITWFLDLAQGESATIAVCVSGTLKAGACGTTQFLSGPWSAAYTDPVSGLPLKSDYTDRASIDVICP